MVDSSGKPSRGPGIGKAKRSAGSGTSPSRKAPPPKQGPIAGAAEQVLFARLVEKESGRPIGGASYEIRDAAGNRIAEGTSDWQGTVLHDVQQAGSYTITVTRVPWQD